MKLIDILAEAARSKPKAVIMAGGAGVGKSTLLNKLDLASLPLVNPDKYVEDPDHPAHNNLAQGSRLADQEAEELSSNKESFVWDTTASNPKKVERMLHKTAQELLTEGKVDEAWKVLLSPQTL